MERRRAHDHVVDGQRRTGRHAHAPLRRRGRRPARRRLGPLEHRDHHRHEHLRHRPGRARADHVRAGLQGDGERLGHPARRPRDRQDGQPDRADAGRRRHLHARRRDPRRAALLGPHGPRPAPRRPALHGLRRRDVLVGLPARRRHLPAGRRHPGDAERRRRHAARLLPGRHRARGRRRRPHDPHPLHRPHGRPVRQSRDERRRRRHADQRRGGLLEPDGQGRRRSDVGPARGELRREPARRRPPTCASSSRS